MKMLPIVQTRMNGRSSGPIRRNYRGRSNHVVNQIHPYVDLSKRPPPLLVATTPTSSHACAACKHQRRRCQPDCILAPFFPADQPDIFINAHRLFGVSNITKLLKSIDVREHRDAMNSIIFHSDCRARYPVGGCLDVIKNLQNKLDVYNAQLAFLNERIAFFQNLGSNSYFIQQQQQQQQTITMPNSNSSHHHHHHHRRHQQPTGEADFLPLLSNVLQQVLGFFLNNLIS